MLLAGYETMKGGFKQGERLIEALKSIDSWWDDIPGELFWSLSSTRERGPRKGDLLSILKIARRPVLHQERVHLPGRLPK